MGNVIVVKIYDTEIKCYKNEHNDSKSFGLFFLFNVTYLKWEIIGHIYMWIYMHLNLMLLSWKCSKAI